MVSQCTVTPSSERTDCCQAEESAQPEPDLEVNIRKIHSSEGLSDENMPAHSMENTGTSEPFALHGLLPKERLLSCCQGARAAQQQPCTGERQWCARTDSDPLAFLTARGKPGVSSTPVCGSVVNPVTDRGKDQPAGAFTPVKDQPASPFTPVKDQPASAFTSVKDPPASPFTSVKDPPASAFTSVKDQPASAFTSVKDPPASAFTSVKDQPASAFTSVKDPPASAFTSVKDPPASAFTSVKDPPASAFTSVKDQPASAFTPVKDQPASAFTSVKDQPASAFTPVKDQPASAFTSVKDQPASAFTPVKDQLASAFTSVKDQPASAFTPVKDQPASAFTSVKDQSASAFTPVKDQPAMVWPPGDVPGAPGFPKMGGAARAPAATGVVPCCPGPHVPEMGVGSRGTDTDRVQAAGDLFFIRECEELPLGLHSCNSFVPPTPPPTRQTSIFSDTWPETQPRGMSGQTGGVPCSCVGCPYCSVNASSPCVSSLCICLAAYLKRLEQQGVNVESVPRAKENQKFSPSARSERPTGKARQGKPSNKTQPGSDSFQNTSLELSSTGYENKTGINKMDRNQTDASRMEAKRTAGTGKARFADNQIPGTPGTGAATQWREDKLSGSESGVMDWSLAVELDSTSISQEIMNLETEVDAGQTSGEVPQQPRSMCTAFAVGTEERTDIKGPAVGRQGDVKKLCDWSIVDACISTERIPNIILGQHGTGDYISGGKEDEKTSGAVEVCQPKGCCMAQPRFTPGEKDQSCVNFIPEFLDNISASANTDNDPEDEIQVMVNVQVESTFSTAVVVDQVKQHVSDALDGVKDNHHQQLQMLQMGMQCRQQMMFEYRKLMEKEEKGARQQHQQSGRTRKDHKSKTKACQIDLENVQPAPQPDPVPAADAQGGQNTREVCERETADQSRTTKQPTTVAGKEAEEVQNVQEARQRGDAVQSRTMQPEPVPGKDAEGGYERDKAVGLSQIAQPETETEQNADQMVNVQVREREAVARSSRTVPAAAAADYERACIYDKYPDHNSATLRLTLRLSHEGVTSQSVVDGVLARTVLEA
ncbi:hypothetical protein ACOMHN_000685 [Nucella lapillus]